MTPQQIKANAPEGSTHYRLINGELEYLKKSTYRDDWYVFWDSPGDWIPTLWKRVEIGKEIKPL